MTKQERMDVRDEAIKKMLALFPEADYLSSDVEWELMKPLAKGTAFTADKVVEMVKDKVGVIEITAGGETQKVVYLPESPKSDFIQPYPFPNPWGVD
jgi:hypothetical protein